MRIPAAAALAALACIATLAKAEPDERHQFDVRTLTNRADLISGGDALVEVAVPRNVPLHQVKLLLNGQDVTRSFVTDADARTMRGALTGLRDGQNSFVADSHGRGNGRPRAQLTITNHSIGGPVLSGPQITPFVCATPTPEVDPATGATTNASGLSGRAARGDTQCKIAAEVKIWYRSTTAGCSLTLPDANTPPSTPCYKPYVSGTPADMMFIEPGH